MQTKIAEKLKGFGGKAKGLFQKMNKLTRILLGVCAVVILVIIIAAALLLNRKEYAVLYSGLSASDTSTIVQYLSDSGVTDYQIQGDSILVPKGRETQLQAQLALSGYPQSGFMYERTSNMGTINTADERDRAFLLDTQDRLGATIRQFDGVREAIVQITPATERQYVLDPNTTPASASVTITPEGNRALDSNITTAIGLLVSHSVKGLDIANVTINDTLGNIYSDSSGFGDISDANAMKLELEQNTNNTIRTSILQLLGPIYGEDNLQVSVRSTADVNRKVSETTTYTQPEGSVQGGGLVDTEKWFWEYINDGTEPVGGTVGTSTNSDIPIYPNLEPNLDGTEGYAGAQGDRHLMLNTKTEQEEGLTADIVDVSIGITINGNCANANALSAEEVRSHAATAAGIQTDDLDSRVSVVIAPFDNTVPYNPNPNNGQLLPGVPNLVLYAAAAGLLLFIILLIIILLLRSRAKKKRLAQQKALEEEMQAAEALAVAAAAAEIPAPTGGADIMEINTEKSMELRKTVRQFAQNNPEIAAQMVKAWLRGGDEDNG